MSITPIPQARFAAITQSRSTSERQRYVVVAESLTDARQLARVATSPDFWLITVRRISAYVQA